MFKPKNHGVIRERKSSDWIAGKIPYEVRNPDGAWPLVRSERQKFGGTETYYCVSFAVLSAMETQILAQTGKEINFSDRFMGTVSGTTKQGNSVSRVLDTLRHLGAVLEDEWQVPPQPFTWEDFASPIPDFIIPRGKTQFLNKYDVLYEYIPDMSLNSLGYQLKHAPLLVTVPGHEMLGVAISGGKLVCLDTYPGSGDYLKYIKLSQVTDIFKAVLTVKDMNNIELVRIEGTEEYGFLETTTYTQIYHQATTFQDLMNLANRFKFTNLDLTQARNIRL
jgi:hypothetical protein